MAVEIRLLRDNENELANNFFNAIYKTHRPIENFVWEFRNGPKGKAIYVVAVDTAETNFTKIVGIQCAIPLELIGSNGATVLTAKSEDTLVDPAYRGQKLFERMYDLLFQECKNAGIRYIWGFTPALKAFERIGFKAPFKTSQALLVLKPMQAYRYLVQLNPSNLFSDKVKIAGLCLISYLRGLTRWFTPKSSLTVQEIPLLSKDAQLKNLYENQHPYYFLRQDESYLNWRIEKNPFRNQYINLEFRNGSAVVADVIVNSREDVSYVEQVFFSGDANSAERAGILRSAVDRIVVQSPLVRALCFETNTALREQGQLLEKIGFTYLKRGNFFVWRSLDEENQISPEDLFLSRLFTQGNL